MKSTLSNYKRTWAKESKGKSKEYKTGLKMGMLATTNDNEIRSWIETLKW